MTENLFGDLPEDDGIVVETDREEEKIISAKPVVEFYATIPDLKGAINVHGSGNVGRVMLEVDLEHYTDAFYELAKMAKTKQLLVKIEPGDEREVTGYHV